MPIERTITSRIKRLIEIGTPMSPAAKQGLGLTDDESQRVTGWLTSADHAVNLVTGPFGPYNTQCINIMAKHSVAFGTSSQVDENKLECVGMMVSLLENLMEDIEAGMIASIIDQVRAETFDDFLDHADKYHKEGRKESGVIAGVVFEDTIRRMGKNKDIPATTLEDIINALVKIDVISKVKAKRAKASADVRTQATHAKWDEFELSDVKATIDFTRELISTHLDA